MGNTLSEALWGKPEVVYVDKYKDITEEKVREAKEKKARQLREQAERERREIQEAERREEERRRQQQQQEEQEKQKEAERLRRLQQESRGQKKKLLRYNFGDKHGLRNFASIDKRDIQRSGLRIGVIGPTGSGKSSFINTCERAMKLTEKGTCETQTSGAEGTTIVQEYLDDIGSKFCLVDTRGFFNYGEKEFTAMTNIVYGRLRPGEKIDLDSAEEAGKDDSWDAFSNGLHAIVIVLAATHKDPLLYSGQHMTNLNTIREFMKPRGISPVTVVTHVDQVRDEKELNKIKLKASAATGSPPSHVYFIENYHPGHNDRDFSIELRAMEILNSALLVGERYVRIHKQQQQYAAEERQAAAVQCGANEPIEGFFRRLCDTRHIPYDKTESVIAHLKEEDVTTAKLLRDNWDDLEAELQITSRMKTYVREMLFK
ncbi:PREDICTED: uncharacterized protein LOC109487625 [Branchiostoma belcheri]|uniref:Uncharacterized protein LOC109487625 n=1 Tax=Branchiostoma belcheri TaxID=7741 RepID=A0A6P5AC17_BRABE|nr:PREDICTED: uncharacterized protein LOC109487625 [Branchiostoma belcheri]